MPASDIFVTRPSLPPLEEFLPYLEKIWDSKILTNGGHMHQALERELSDYLGVPYISLFNNGTIALLTALKALGIAGEVITTPYSFVATSHSLLWNNFTPVFVDIDPLTFNIDPSKIEAAITPFTSAILAVHCYGWPCDTVKIAAIAKRHNLKVIYDGAHAFGVCTDGRSLLCEGHLSIMSFHATKVFSTFEGGAIVSHDSDTKQRIDRLKNFGFVNETSVELVGINGKLSEVCAAFGLLQLRYIDSYIEKRKLIAARYNQLLRGIDFIKVVQEDPTVIYNYAYYPILIEAGFKLTRDEMYLLLKSHGIYTRRYFYPLITDFPMYKQFVSDALPIAEQVASNVLCLPIYPDLTAKEVDFIADVIVSQRV